MSVGWHTISVHVSPVRAAEYKFITIRKEKILFSTIIAAYPNWKKSHQYSERLAPLSIRGAKLKAPLKPLDTIVM